MALSLTTINNNKSNAQNKSTSSPKQTAQTTPARTSHSTNSTNTSRPDQSLSAQKAQRSHFSRPIPIHNALRVPSPQQKRVERLLSSATHAHTAHVGCDHGRPITGPASVADHIQLPTSAPTCHLLPHSSPPQGSSQPAPQCPACMPVTLKYPHRPCAPQTTSTVLAVPTIAKMPSASLFTSNRSKLLTGFVRSAF